MDLAMRVARYFLTVVLTGVACQVLPFGAQATDSAAVVMTDDSPEPQTRGRIVDEAVQQAGYYDSRPRPNETSVSLGSESGRNGSLFSSDSLRLPKFPFGRQTATKRPAARPTQPVAKQVKPTIAGQLRQRQMNQPMPAAKPLPQRTMSVAQMSAAQMPAAAAPAANSNLQNPRNPAGPRPMPLAQNALPNPMQLAARPSPTAAPNSSSVSPWTVKPTPAPAAVKPVTPAANNAAPPAAQPVMPTAPTLMPPGNAATPAAPQTQATPAATRQSAQLSAGDRLVAEAHAVSLKAKTEQDYSRIIETCRRAQASQASPESAKYANNLTAWSFNRRGQLKAEAGHDKDAILDFDDAIRADSSCWRAVHNRGVLLAQAAQFEKAFDDFSRTIQLNPQFAKAYSNRAALFMVANNLNAAHQDYQRAIELDPNLAVAHRGCGRVCQLLGNLDQAVGHYDAAVQLAPNDAYAAACRADLLTDVGRYSDALTEYDRAMQLDPNSSQANCGLAWLLATCPDSALRNPELAIERAKQAIELSGAKDAVSYDSLAAAEASAGDFTAAMQSIRRAIELAPVDERDAYKERLVMYQQAKPYRIAPVERMAQQASYQAR
jgi:tetratricopeptide (TPR) repeat protein